MHGTPRCEYVSGDPHLPQQSKLLFYSDFPGGREGGAREECRTDCEEGGRSAAQRGHHRPQAESERPWAGQGQEVGHRRHQIRRRCAGRGRREEGRAGHRHDRREGLEGPEGRRTKSHGQQVGGRTRAPFAISERGPAHIYLQNDLNMIYSIAMTIKQIYN